MNGYGWCLLRAQRPADVGSLEADPDVIDDEANAADRALWASFRRWMETNAGLSVAWDFREQHNNDRGLLTFSVSRNHRPGPVWSMLDWVAENGPGSYGLLYVHDDEDERRLGADHSNSSAFTDCFTAR